MGKSSLYQYRICNLYLSSTIPFSLPTVRGKRTKVADIRFTMDLSNPRMNVPTNHPVGIIRNGAEQPTIVVYQTNGGFLLDCNSGYKRIQFTVASDGSWIECYPFNGAVKEDIELWLFELVLPFVLQTRRIDTVHLRTKTIALTSQSLIREMTEQDTGTTVARYHRQSNRRAALLRFRWRSSNP